MSQENVEQMRAFAEDGRPRPCERRVRPRSRDSQAGRTLGPGNRVGCLRVSVLDISGVYRGADAARNWWREWYAAWDTLRFEYELLDAGDRVVMLLELRLRGRSTGIEFPPAKGAWVSTFRDGLVVHMKLYMSQSEALEAAGLSE